MDTLIKTGSLDMRGREVLDNTPIEIPLANMKRTPSIFERMRAIILQQQKDAEDVIVDEADLAEDLNDFSYENESDLFTENTQYTVPDDVSDYVSAKEIREKAKEKAEQKVQENPKESVENQRPQRSIGYLANATQGQLYLAKCCNFASFCQV